MRMRERLKSGLVIPAHPLALTANRKFDERRQRTLTRYYLEAGAGGLAVGVHTTQFAIREHGLLETALQTANGERRTANGEVVMIAGVVGPTKQAVAEAELAAGIGYDVALVSLGALASATDAELIAHCRAIAEVMPLFGFYLQPAVGGRVLSYEFWRAFAELERVWAVKIAPFNRYHTFDVVRAIGDAGRDDIALYTGNDDNIVADLVTPFPTAAGTRYIDGGLLGQWAVGTRAAVEMLARCKRARAEGISTELLRAGAELTDFNAAMFDVAHGFAGCIPGIHEVLRRAGLLAGTWCLDERETLSPGQSAELDRVTREHAWVTDYEFIKANSDRWVNT